MLELNWLWLNGRRLGVLLYRLNERRLCVWLNGRRMYVWLNRKRLYVWLDRRQGLGVLLRLELHELDGLHRLLIT